MERAVDQSRLGIHNREARKNAGPHDAVDALLDAGHELLRNRTADDLRFEDVALAGFVRLEDDLDAGELARAAGLLLVRIVLLDPTCQLLAISDLRGADIRVDFVGGGAGYRP